MEDSVNECILVLDIKEEDDDFLVAEVEELHFAIFIQHSQ